jgi:anti-sigma regulatory factor (Ser/Thr protein kinase)
VNRPSRATRFPADPGSIADARRFAAKVVGRVHPELREATSLLVSELATNAIRHGRSEFAVEVEALPTRVLVRVSDVGRGWPEAADVAPTDTGGRGLRIVDVFADAWGVVPTTSTLGKTVWFELLAGGTPGFDGDSNEVPRR